MRESAFRRHCPLLTSTVFAETLRVEAATVAVMSERKSASRENENVLLQER